MGVWGAPLACLSFSSSRAHILIVKHYARSCVAPAQKQPCHFRSTYVERSAQWMFKAYQKGVAHDKSKCGSQGLYAYFACENMANKGSKQPCCCLHSESVQTDVLARFQMASFGLSVQKIWIRPFSSPESPSESYSRFASRWFQLHTSLSRSR